MQVPAAEEGQNEEWPGGDQIDLLSLGDPDQTTLSPGVLPAGSASWGASGNQWG